MKRRYPRLSPTSSPASLPRLTAQLIELQRKFDEAVVNPPVPGALGDHEGAGHFESSSLKGVVYMIDPALELEVEILKETVAERERVIEELKGRHRVRIRIPLEVCDGGGNICTALIQYLAAAIEAFPEGRI